MLIEPIEIKLIDKTTTFIFPEAIPLNKHRKISTYYNCLKQKVTAEKQVYPFMPYGRKIGIKYQDLYQKIGNLIDENIEWEKVEPEDLYYFFILRVNGEEIRNSNLDLLLGYSDTVISDRENPDNNIPIDDIDEVYQEDEEAAAEQLTTGDLLLDVEVNTLLNFKQGHLLLATHSFNQLIAMNKYASELMEKAREDAEKKEKKGSVYKFSKERVKQAPQLVESPEFIESKAEIKASLEAANIPIPESL